MNNSFIFQRECSYLLNRPGFKEITEEDTGPAFSRTERSRTFEEPRVCGNRYRKNLCSSLRLQAVFRRTTKDSERLVNFSYKGLAGYRIDQGEYRIIYAIDEKERTVFIGAILNRKEGYKELKNLK
jgi:mRNA-degrading endonuclease RelE of RelBE toxin-antitoxin system